MAGRASRRRRGQGLHRRTGLGPFRTLGPPARIRSPRARELSTPRSHRLQRSPAGASAAFSPADRWPGISNRPSPTGTRPPRVTWPATSTFVTASPCASRSPGRAASWEQPPGLLEHRRSYVVPLAREGSTATGPGGPRWSPEAGLLDPEGIQPFDAVVHLAGEGIASGRWSAERKRRIRDSRVDGTRNLVRTLGSSRRRLNPGVRLGHRLLRFPRRRGARRDERRRRRLSGRNLPRVGSRRSRSRRTRHPRRPASLRHHLSRRPAAPSPRCCPRFASEAAAFSETVVST